MPRSKKQSTLATVKAEIPTSDLPQRVGHRIRRPLIHIIEQTDTLLSVNSQVNAADTKATLGLISGEAYQVLEMYDWVLALFELTLRPNAATELNPSQFITAICLEIETGISSDLLGYRLICTIPDKLPMISMNGHLLQRAIHLMIRLIGNNLHPGYVQVDVQATDNHLSIQTSAIAKDGKIALKQPELETLILESIARVCGGKFTWSYVNSRLELILHLPIVH